MAPLERAARAMARYEYGDGYEEPWEPFIPLARAALDAIREPDEAMLGACDNISIEPEHPSSWRAEQYWRAMIDVALREGE